LEVLPSWMGSRDRYGARLWLITASCPKTAYRWRLTADGPTLSKFPILRPRGIFAGTSPRLRTPFCGEERIDHCRGSTRGTFIPLLRSPIAANLLARVQCPIRCPGYLVPSPAAKSSRALRKRCRSQPGP
jgi:hypothetical protein